MFMSTGSPKNFFIAIDSKNVHFFISSCKYFYIYFILFLLV